MVDAFRQQLQDPRLRTEYVSAYREERRALADRAIRDRSRIERKLANAKATLNRTIDAYVKGAMTVEELGSRRVEMDAEVARWEAKLAKAEPVPAIELHPQAVERSTDAISKTFTPLSRGGRRGRRGDRWTPRRWRKSWSPLRPPGSRSRSRSRGSLRL